MNLTDRLLSPLGWVPAARSGVYPMGLIFPDRGEARGCRDCGEHAEACTCPLYLTPYAIAFLERAAANCATDRVRIDLLTAHRSLVERNASLSKVLPSDQPG